MKSKNIIIIIAIVAIVVIAAAVFFIYQSSPYTEYSTAFSNTTKSGSLEFNTSINATMDGETTTANGNMKIKDITKTASFINKITINGEDITQYSDGEYIYQDNGYEKTKFKIDTSSKESPEPEIKKEDTAFDESNFLEEFSALIDASKIHDIKIADKLNENIVSKIEKKTVGSGTQFEITIAEQVVNDILKSIMNEQEGQTSPTFTLKSFLYTANSNSDKLIDNVTYKVDMDVSFPASLTGESSESTKNVQLEIKLDIINPGTAVEVDLPNFSDFIEKR